ncbi:MAG TPA: metallophosphoesterase [Acidimicrobiia bacterium]|jgi:predicted phosphodiesterase
MSVGPDEVVVTFTSPADASVVTQVGEHEVVTAGPIHVARVTGLEADTEYRLVVEGAVPDRWLPTTVHTLERPPGALRATIATANDVHFGETRCGATGDPATDAIGPILSSAPGEPPYPETMNRGAVAEIAAIDPDAVVVKGDLTDTGRPEEYAEFLAVYGALGDRMHHIRGNHDAMRDVTLAAQRTPYAVPLPGVTLAVLDTTAAGHVGGSLPAEQVEWLDDLAGAATDLVLVFGHHPVWNLETHRPVDPHYAIAREGSAALLDVIARRESVAGYFAGHTHTNRVCRYERARNVPCVEVACTKDYPGAWAEYRVYEGGYTQVMRRISSPDALRWSERCRAMIQGIYRDLVLGRIEDRCFTYCPPGR